MKLIDPKAGSVILTAVFLFYFDTQYENNWFHFGTDNWFWHHIGIQKYFTNWLDGSPIIKGQNLMHQTPLPSITDFSVNETASR